jgi:DUF2934 family protein
MKTFKKPGAGGSTPEPATPSATEEAIRERAYERYEQRRRLDGQAVEDWLAAEAELQLKSKGAAA